MRNMWWLFLVLFAFPAYAEEPSTPSGNTEEQQPIVTKDIPPPSFDYQLPEEPVPDAATSTNNQTPPAPPQETLPSDEEDPLFSLPEEEAIQHLFSDEQEKTTGTYTSKASLQGLNKVTAKAYTFEAPVNTPVTFGSLEVTLKKCWKSAPEDMPENKALLEIWETKPGEEKQQIFYGWMFSSSPAVSALEHPVYDITVLSCEEGATPAPKQ